MFNYSIIHNCQKRYNPVLNGQPTIIVDTVNGISNLSLLSNNSFLFIIIDLWLFSE